jgi:hypothetical protein
MCLEKGPFVGEAREGVQVGQRRPYHETQSELRAIGDARGSRDHPDFSMCNYVHETRF